MHTKIRMYFQHFSLSFCNESLLKLIQLDIIIHTKFYSTERNTFQLKCVHTLYDRYTRNGTSDNNMLKYIHQDKLSTLYSQTAKVYNKY